MISNNTGGHKENNILYNNFCVLEMAHIKLLRKSTLTSEFNYLETCLVLYLRLCKQVSSSLSLTLLTREALKIQVMLVYPLVDKSEEAGPLTRHRVIFYLKQDQAIWAEHHRQHLRPFSFK